MREETAQASRRGLAQRLYELFNERDIDALLELAAPDIEWDWSRSIGPDNGVHIGTTALRRFLDTSWEHWERIEMVPEEIIESGDDVVVLVLVRLQGRDGIELEAHGPHVQTWRDERLVRYRLFQEIEDARAAVGL